MAEMPYLERLEMLDTNTVSDALDHLGLPGATVGILPLWDCPKIVGRASTVQLGRKTDGVPQVHLITPVINKITADDRVLVVAGGADGISCWGDILANAARAKHIRGTVIDGWSRDIEGSEKIAYPVFGRGVTMISARNRVVQVSSGNDITVAGVTVHEGDYLVADRCGVVFIPEARIGEVVALGESIDQKQAGMVRAVLAGVPVDRVMHDREFDASGPGDL
jgi:regulator of RNase E activity RraA